MHTHRWLLWGSLLFGMLVLTGNALYIVEQGAQAPLYSLVR